MGGVCAAPGAQDVEEELEFSSTRSQLADFFRLDYLRGVRHRGFGWVVSADEELQAALLQRKQTGLSVFPEALCFLLPPGERASVLWCYVDRAAFRRALSSSRAELVSLADDLRLRREPPEAKSAGGQVAEFCIPVLVPEVMVKEAAERTLQSLAEEAGRREDPEDAARAEARAVLDLNLPEQGLLRAWLAGSPYAEHVGRRRLARAEHWMGYLHPDTVAVVDELAALQIGRGKKDEAVELMRRSENCKEDIGEMRGTRCSDLLISLEGRAPAAEAEGKVREEVAHEAEADRALEPEPPPSADDEAGPTLALVPAVPPAPPMTSPRGGRPKSGGALCLTDGPTCLLEESLLRHKPAMLALCDAAAPAGDPEEHHRLEDIKLSMLALCDVTTAGGAPEDSPGRATTDAGDGPSSEAMDEADQLALATTPLRSQAECHAVPNSPEDPGLGTERASHCAGEAWLAPNAAAAASAPSLPTTGLGASAAGAGSPAGWPAVSPRSASAGNEDPPADPVFSAPSNWLANPVPSARSAFLEAEPPEPRSPPSGNDPSTMALVPSRRVSAAGSGLPTTSLVFNISQPMGINFDSNAIAQAVQRGSQAESLGVQAGWKVLAVRGQAVGSLSELDVALRSLRCQRKKMTALVDFATEFDKYLHGVGSQNQGVDTDGDTFAPMVLRRFTKQEHRALVRWASRVCGVLCADASESEDEAVGGGPSGGAAPAEDELVQVVVSLSQPLGVLFSKALVANAVKEGSQAASLGVREGWRLCRVRGEPVHRLVEMNDRLQALKATGCSEATVSFVATA